MSPSLAVHILQMQSVDDINENVSQVEGLLASVPDGSEPALVCLPENALYFRLREGSAIPGLGLSDSCFQQFQKWAAAKNLIFHIGSVPLRDGEKLTNCSAVVWPDGRIEATYQKIHLFDIELDGQKPIRESDVFRAGDRPEILRVKDWNLGQTICYDLRFSELFSFYAGQKVDALVVPSAFLKTTGEAHWHVLLRARAIESQCFVIAAAQAGEHRSAGGSRQTYGHSLIIDPWGRILSEGSGDRAEVLSFSLDRELLARVRKQIPMAAHRRLV